MPEPVAIPADTTGPYAATARAYHAAGWWPLPLPARAKTPPPDGWTGRSSKYDRPSGADIEEWVNGRGAGNIALRLPRDILGIDVDNYGTKQGAFTLFDLERRVIGEPLPPTWRVTSRDDGISGIRFFRIPEGLKWPGVLGAGIEVIRYEHRYAVVWPSIHPDTGGTYRWVGPDRIVTLGVIPAVDDLPHLPLSWVHHFTGGEADEDRPTAGLTPDGLDAWGRGLAAGPPCGRVRHATKCALDDIADPAAGARHDSALRGAARLAHLGGDGHHGVRDALAEVGSAFTRAVGKDRPGAAAEWARIVDAVIDTAAVDHPTPATTDPCDDRERSTREQVDGLIPPDQPINVSEPSVPAVPEHHDFWDARPELAHIRDFARARRTSPWALLGIALAEVVARTEPAVQLPAIVGTRASLNTFIGIVGPSGAGKGAAEGAARDAFDFDPLMEPPRWGVGSGEGILHAYVHHQAKTEDTPAGIVQHATRVMFSADEVDTLAALKNRTGSTLLPLLRSAWTGGHLSLGYADPTRRLHVAAHAYRLTLTVGIQPGRAGVLLDDSDGGTPQRFLWLPATDPHAPRERPPEPRPFPWTPPTTWPDAYGRYVMPVCQTAVDAIDTGRLNLLHDHVDAIDGHIMLCRLKTAGALAILNGRADVADDDWSLAGVVMAVSNQCRTSIRDELNARREAAAEARGKDEGRRQIAAAEVVEGAVVQRVRRRVLAMLTPEWQPRSALRKRLKSTDREHFDDAIDALVRDGLADRRDGDYRGQATVEYRLIGGAS